MAALIVLPSGLRSQHPAQRLPVALAELRLRDDTEVRIDAGASLRGQTMSKAYTRRHVMAASASAATMAVTSTAFAQARPSYRDATASVASRVGDLISRMSLEEKAA